LFARRLKLTLRSASGETPVPKAWLDQFFMRNFTGHSAFDETLPEGDGLLEAGAGVEAERVQDEFGKWLRGRRMIPAGTELIVSE
jgi:hypothetical protein